MVADRLAIDCNAFIAYRAGDNNVREAIEQSKLLFLPMPVIGELLYGAMNSMRREDNIRAVNEFAEQCMPIYVDEAVAGRYASVRLQLKQNGSPIPENDIWIAASCIEVGVELLTQDNHFTAIDGLSVVRW